MGSILTTTKKVLGLGEEYTAFDTDIIVHINAGFAQLHQLGVGPEGGFQISSKTETWEQFLGNDPTLNTAKSWMVLFVKLRFDPPTTSYGIAAVQDAAKEDEWRLSIHKES